MALKFNTINQSFSGTDDFTAVFTDDNDEVGAPEVIHQLRSDGKFATLVPLWRFE
jgi:hypothetical protein